MLLNREMNCAADVPTWIVKLKFTEARVSPDIGALVFSVQMPVETMGPQVVMLVSWWLM